MISFELTEEQEIIRSTMAEFAQSVLKPAARRGDEDSRLADTLVDQLWSMGIVQAQADKSARSPVTNAIILEELAAGDAGAAAAVAASMAFVQSIVDQGSEEQQALFLADLEATAFRPGAIAIMEPSFGADFTRLATRAEKTADGFKLNGAKAMVPLAERCSHFLVVADQNGVSQAFLVPRNAAGVEVCPAEGTLGLRAIELAEINFIDVAVSQSMRLGAANGSDCQRLIDAARVGAAAMMIGICRSVLAYVVPYVKERVVHGVPLGQKQAVAFNVADMHIEIEAMRWMVWRAAWELESGRSATRSAQLAFTYAAQQAVQLADNGVQALGGHGYVQEHPMEMWYRNVCSLARLEGVAGV